MIHLHKIHALMLTALILLVAVMVSAVVAQSLAGLEINNVSFVACDGANLEGALSITAKDGSGNIINNTSAVPMLLYFEADSGVVGTASVNLRSTDIVPFAVSPTSGTMTYAQIYTTAPDGSARSNVIRIGCDGAISNLGGGLFGVDDRINRLHGDLINPLYVRADEQGALGVQVYRVEDRAGVLAGMFTASDFAPYLKTPPTENTKIATLDRSTLYALESGEFQIVIGPDVEGKIYNVIFSGMPPKNIRFSGFNLYAAQGR